MSKPEQLMWQALRPHLAAMRLDPVRIETLSQSGIPDVNYNHGWVELKHLDDWPRLARLPVTVKTLVERKEQVVFLMRRWAAGGPAFLMLRVHDEWLLFSGWDSRTVRLGATRNHLERLAVWRTGPGGVRPKDLPRLGQWLALDEDAMDLPDRARLLRLRCRKSVEAVAADIGWGEELVWAAEKPDASPIDRQYASDLIEYFTC